MKKKLLFIANPVSGSVSKLRLEHQVQKHIDSDRYEYDLIFTDYARHLTEIGHAQKAEYDAFIVVGGDGTVNELVQALVYTNIPLGIIPAGSGNGFARTMNIPLSVGGAIEAINSFHVRKVDTIRINKHYMVNVGGLGFDGHISKLFHHSQKRGFETYIKLVAAEFMHYKPLQYKIQTPDGVVYKEAFLVSVSNTGQFGNNAFISPTSKIDDGLFEISILSKFPLYAAPDLAMRLFSKSMHKSKYMHTITAKKATIFLPENYTTHLDGDFMDLGRDLEIEIQPLSLNVLVP